MKKLVSTLLLLALMAAFPAQAEEAAYFYNPDGGRYYHSIRECKTMRAVYQEQMLQITAAQLTEAPYAQLKPCNICCKEPPSPRSLPAGTMKFYHHSSYDTGDADAQFTAGSYHAGKSILPGIYTAVSGPEAADALQLLSQEEALVHAYPMQGETRLTFYLGEGMHLIIPEHCTVQKVIHQPGFQEAYVRTPIAHARYFTMLEIPGAQYCVESMPGKNGYYVLSTIQSELGQESPTVVKLAEGDVAELNLQGAYDVFVEFVDCIVWPSEQGVG